MSETKVMRHKLDGMIAKNKELESNLDEAVKQQLKSKEKSADMET